ncbi:uncharacterized protein A1O9_12882 [Exophiala aquamarina CBS 119918]|uniref:Major facilitator superfamily (MFS) profile domain-containing protein n=1 Tax=Exophiala aquamarina CBS 119918 TaxID=1182545 RepID=A0A072NTS4_9EURO|nr:uncharacterized protein A1O9_12882 [Exophiala aquamarina CBS 119918]KEF51066.1 hypothetical protein A1O9_12882 [Exophiala aquamarina CBS 119918]
MERPLAVSTERYSGYNVAVVVFAAFGSWLSGYGLAVIIATIGQPSFYASIDLDPDPTSPGYRHTSDIIATVQGIFFAGGALGCIFAGSVGRLLGRIRSFQLCAAICITGAAIQTGAVNQAMYIAARFITGFGTGHTFAAMPVYLAEVAPPHSRGLMVGVHGSVVNVGYMTAAWVGFGTFHSSSSFAWRFPNAILIILALCFFAGTFYMPESPRWLVLKDRDDEALKILRRLHHDPSDPQDSFARRELRLIHKQIALDNRALQEGGRWQLFTEPTYRRRIILSILVVVGTQNTAILVITNYNALFYQSLGLSNSEALITSAGFQTWAVIWGFLGLPLSDRVGRRRLLLIGFVSIACVLSIATGLIAKYNRTRTKSWAAASLAFLYLFVSCYTCFIEVNCWTVATEIFPSHLRPQGTGIAIAALMLTDLLWLQLAPTAQSTIGWKYYIVFIVLTAAHAVYFYFELPEASTSGLALEEIDKLFGKEPASCLADVENDDYEKGEDHVEHGAVAEVEKRD